MSKQYEVVTGPVYFRVNSAMTELNVGDVVTLSEAAAGGLIKKGWIKAQAQAKAKPKPKFQPKTKAAEG
jgi:hypothetical protein